jgi:hypothetical protein
MRILSIIILCSIISFTDFSQESNIEEKVQIKNVINQFFEAIEKKDSILRRLTILHDAQVWRRSINEGTSVLIKILLQRCLPGQI